MAKVVEVTEGEAWCGGFRTEEMGRVSNRRGESGFEQGRGIPGRVVVEGRSQEKEMDMGRGQDWIEGSVLGGAERERWIWPEGGVSPEICRARGRVVGA